MRCSKCGREVPKDSDFCQYCGTSIEHKPLEPENYFIDEPKNVERKVSAPLIAAICIAIIMTVLNIVQYNNNQKVQERVNIVNEQLDELKSAVADKDKTIKDKDNKIESLTKDVDELEQNLTKSQDKLEIYDEIVYEFDPTEKYGYASSGFKVSDGIIILEKGGRGKTITLTADFDGYVDITSDTDGMSADINWNEETWSGSTTTLEVVPSPYITGVTKITFSNNMNSRTFKVFVIVIE